MLDLNDSPANQARLMGLIDRLTSMYQQWLGRPDSRNGVSSAFRISSGYTTSIGYYRDNNEDRVSVDDSHQLFVVADGMGGQAAGEQASQLAVDIVPRELARVPSDVTATAEIRDAIRKAVLTANESIITKGDADPSTQNMGTTIVLGYCRGTKMYVAHVGDSRAYHIRDGKIARITTDHNLAQALYEANTITESELDTHRFRHVLWKYLGSKEVGEGPDITDIELRPGDRFLLATDGVTGSVSDDDICKVVLAEPDPQVCADSLVKLALDNGSRDNVSCVVLHVDGTESEGVSSLSGSESTDAGEMSADPRLEPTVDDIDDDNDDAFKTN